MRKVLLIMMLLVGSLASAGALESQGFAPSVGGRGIVALVRDDGRLIQSANVKVRKFARPHQTSGIRSGSSSMRLRAQRARETIPEAATFDPKPLADHF
jgi:hypothetical protein